MTSAQILQAFFDHWHLREENRQRIRLNAPARTRYWRAWT